MLLIHINSLTYYSVSRIYASERSTAMGCGAAICEEAEIAAEASTDFEWLPCGSDSPSSSSSASSIAPEPRKIVPFPVRALQERMKTPIFRNLHGAYHNGYTVKYQ